MTGNTEEIDDRAYEAWTASDVTVTKPDGTVETQPAYDRGTLHAIISKGLKRAKRQENKRSKQELGV